MVLSVIDIIRRTELSLTASHPTLLLYYVALGTVLTHCVVLATASKETIAAFLFVVGTAMQCMQLLLFCSLSAADVALTHEAHMQCMPAAVCYFLVLGGYQGFYPFPEEVRALCSRSPCTGGHQTPSARALTWTPHAHTTGALRQEPGHFPRAASGDLSDLVPAHRESRGANC